jgi:hypothetical protein
VRRCTCVFPITDLDVVKITDDYRSREIPLDVFVIDMDWCVPRRVSDCCRAEP